MSIKPCGVVSEWTPSATACRGQLCCIQTIRARQLTYGLRASVELRRRRRQWTGTSPCRKAGCSVRIGVGRGAHWGQDRFYRCVACLALRAHILGDCICTAYMRSSPLSAAGAQTTFHLDALPIGDSVRRTRGQYEGQLCARHGARTSILNRRRRPMLPLRTVHPASSKRPPCCDVLESQVHSCHNILFEVVPPLFFSTFCSILRWRRVGDRCAIFIF